LALGTASIDIRSAPRDMSHIASRLRSGQSREAAALQTLCCLLRTSARMPTLRQLLPDSWPGRSMVRPTCTAPGSKGWLGERGLKEWLTVGREQTVGLSLTFPKAGRSMSDNIADIAKGAGTANFVAIGRVFRLHNSRHSFTSRHEIGRKGAVVRYSQSTLCCADRRSGRCPFGS
jgi:hypothetical protein